MMLAKIKIACALDYVIKLNSRMSTTAYLFCFPFSKIMNQKIVIINY